MALTQKQLESYGGDFKTEEELIEALTVEIRNHRNSLLEKTDYIFLPDINIDETLKQLIIEYRQALRDIPSQQGFPLDVVWPTAPHL